MKLIFLYGPPASGKYTIAKVLAEKLGYKLFHNHLTVDLAKGVFDYGTKAFWELVHKTRLDIFEKAAKENISGMIFTYVYEKDNDDSFVKQALEKINSNGGEIIFIQIYCNKKTLLKRVKEDSRKQFQKVKTEEGLLEMLSHGDLFSEIPFVENNIIDNTNLTVEKTVQKVLTLIK
ncbi:MAG: AAA family ATPase [Patescibacteria group bacterium]|mgnify:CR=1 FL=1